MSVSTFDWKSEVLSADPDWTKQDVAYRFAKGKRIFVSPRQPYTHKPYLIGVGTWAVGRDFVVAPSTGDLLTWLEFSWPGLRN